MFQKKRGWEPCVLGTAGGSTVVARCSIVYVKITSSLTNQNPLFCRVPINSIYGFILGTYKIVGSGWLRLVIVEAYVSIASYYVSRIPQSGVIGSCVGLYSRLGRHGACRLCQV